MTLVPMRRLLPLFVVVSLAHWASLTWLHTLLPPVKVLTQMAEPLFTRLLHPAQPSAPSPPPVAVPAPKAPRKTATVRNLAQPLEASPPTAVIESTPEPDAGTAAAQPVEPPAAEATPVPTPSAAVESAPSEPVAARADPLQSWPLDTRLSYRLGGFYRGDLHGSARVQWQRDKGSYQVMLSVSAAGLTLATLTSQGEATPAGLVPRVYEEQVPGGLRRAEFGEGHVRFQDGSLAVLPAGAQDTVSQFVDLAHRFSTGRATLAAGTPVRVWLGRPGGLDEWIYDVGDIETLQTPQLGPVAAFHLTPRPLANPRGAITAELWFAPSLQYLPVRVRITLGGGNFVDLMIEQIEQAEISR